MRRLYPGFHCKRAGPFATWRGDVQPTSWCPIYRVQIVYSPSCRGRPGTVRVTIVDPQLPVSDDQLGRVHLYRDRSLCLYNPNRREWNAGMSVAATIVPWTSEWVYFFEVWRYTGEWLGGGEHGDAHLRDARAA